MEQKHLYWSYQSSQSINPTEQELKLFQNKYKSDFEQRTVYEGEELEDKFRLNAWRNPLFSEITSIILAFEHEGTLRVKYITGSESDLLQNFVNLVRLQFQDYTLTHFDAEIVLPYIGLRLNKHGFINMPSKDLEWRGNKPWTLSGFDLKSYYKGAGKYSFSLEDIAYILDINTEGLIFVEDEFSYYNSGDLESLKKSAIKKIEVISQIHRKLFELPPLQTVLVEEQVKDVIAEAPKDWLKELYNANQFTNEIKEGLRQQIFGNKKKPTKAELNHLFSIISGVYIQNDFINGKVDSKKVIEEKESEIRSLLKMI